MKRRHQEVQIVWKLRTAMAEANIPSATELARRLIHRGYNITSTHAARIVKEVPGKLSIELLTHLLNVLECSISELLLVLPIEDTNDGNGADSSSTNSPSGKASSEHKKSDIVSIGNKPVATKKVRIPDMSKGAESLDDEAFFGPKLKPTFNPYEANK